jgi:gluconolactonase
MELVVFNERVHDLVDESAEIEKLDTGFVFVEGPVYLNGTYYFTDFQVDKIYTYKDGVTTLIDDKSDFSIGMTYDRKNDRILRATRNQRAITTLDNKVVCNNYNGIPINGSNDVIVDSKGRIYFSDPIPTGKVLEGPQMGHPSTFMYDADKDEMVLLDKTLSRPNGLALSPDEKFLYIDDTNTSAVHRLDMHSLKIELFAQFDDAMGDGRCDGMRIDELGNLYVTGPGGVWMVAADGTILGLMKTPEPTANLCFDDSGLFLTATTSIYRVDTKIPSAV